MNVCSIQECGRPHKALGFCDAHYARSRKGQELSTPLKKQSSRKECSVERCRRPYYSNEFCAAHYQRDRNGLEMSSDIQIHAYEERLTLEMVQVSGFGADNGEGYKYITRNGKNVKVHRLVMELSLGRKLYPHERVHHKNGVRDDNKLSNLELWSTSQPAGQRVVDKVAWAKEILEMYPQYV